jgi:hypothetical protein
LYYKIFNEFLQEVGTKFKGGKFTGSTNGPRTLNKIFDKIKSGEKITMYNKRDTGNQGDWGTLLESGWGDKEVLSFLNSNGIISSANVEDLNQGDLDKLNDFFETVFSLNKLENFKKIAKSKDAIVRGSGMQVLGSDNVKSINDGIVQTHRDDTILAAKPGGGFDKLFTGILPEIDRIGKYVSSMGGFGGNSTFTINGSVKLTSDSGNSIDIIPMLKNNPDLLRQLVNILISGSEIYHNGGKTNEFLRI